MQVMTQLAFKGQCREAFELYEKVLGARFRSSTLSAAVMPSCRRAPLHLLLTRSDLQSFKSVTAPSWATTFLNKSSSQCPALASNFIVNGDHRTHEMNSTLAADNSRTGDESTFIEPGRTSGIYQ